MNTHANAGIDYGMGTTNIDHKTGIRYGVIHQNECLSAWCEDSRPDYGPARCPQCCNPADSMSDLPEDYEETYTMYMRSYSSDYACKKCKILFVNEDAFPEKPLSCTLSGVYEAESGSDGDIFITKSPYYTRCQFCSPCAPGAGYLMNECEDGVKTYCFGHDMFWDTPNKKAPYRVFRVSDDTEVLPENEQGDNT